MPRAFMMTPTAPTPVAKTARLGAGTGSSNNFTLDTELNKWVKLSGESAYNLCAVGNEIEGYVSSVETATQGGWSIGGVISSGRAYVVFDGLQATPATGTLAVGDYVVCGTIVAKGTGLAAGAGPKVCKATAAATGIVFKWRVISLGSAGTGAVGTTGVIEYVP